MSEEIKETNEFTEVDLDEMYARFDYMEENGLLPPVPKSWFPSIEEINSVVLTDPKKMIPFLAYIEERIPDTVRKIYKKEVAYAQEILKTLI